MFVNKYNFIFFKTFIYIILFQAGCIPNLTYDVLQKITTDQFPMQYPLNTLYRVTEPMKQYEKALHSFVGLPVSCEIYFFQPYFCMIEFINDLPCCRNTFLIVAFKILCIDFLEGNTKGSCSLWILSEESNLFLINSKLFVHIFYISSFYFMHEWFIR